MKSVIIKVSLLVLERMLCLDKLNLKITRARQTWEDENSRVMELMLEGDTLPAVKEGSPIPIVILEMTIKNKQIVSSRITK